MEEEECADLPQDRPQGSMAVADTDKEKGKRNTDSQESSDYHPKSAKEAIPPGKTSGRRSSSSPLEKKKKAPRFPDTATFGHTTQPSRLRFPPREPVLLFNPATTLPA